VNGDSFDTHLAAGALYAQGDFAPIGYDNFIEHVVGSA
jgi:hypothetical protein